MDIISSPSVSDVSMCVSHVCVCVCDYFVFVEGSGHTVPQWAQSPLDFGTFFQTLRSFLLFSVISKKKTNIKPIKNSNDLLRTRVYPSDYYIKNSIKRSMTYSVVRNSYHVKFPVPSFLSVLEVLCLALRKIQDNNRIEWIPMHAYYKMTLDMFGMANYHTRLFDWTSKSVFWGVRGI